MNSTESKPCSSSSFRLSSTWGRSWKLLDVPTTMVNCHAVDALACRASYANFFNILTLCSVVKTTVLLADINDFNRVNEVYRTCEFPPFIGMFRYCHLTLTIRSHIFKIYENQKYPILNFSVSYFIWVKTNYSAGESRGIPRLTEKYSPFILFAVIMAAVEPSKLEMDTTMKTHRCNLTIAASDPETGLSPSPWGLWTQDNSLGTFTDPPQRPRMLLNSCWIGHICIRVFFLPILPFQSFNRCCLLLE